MKKILYVSLLSVVAFALDVTVTQDPFQFNQEQQMRQQQMLQQQFEELEQSIRHREQMQLQQQQLQMQQQQLQMQQQAQAQAQHQMRIEAYQRTYENNPAKEKQLDKCVEQMLINGAGKKSNPKPCLDYLNPNK